MRAWIRKNPKRNGQPSALGVDLSLAPSLSEQGPVMCNALLAQACVIARRKAAGGHRPPISPAMIPVATAGACMVGVPSPWSNHTRTQARPKWHGLYTFNAKP